MTRATPYPEGPRVTRANGHMSLVPAGTRRPSVVAYGIRVSRWAAGSSRMARESSGGPR